MRLLPCGDAAVLVEVAELDDVLALHAGLMAEPVDGVVDLVPAARTLLVRIDPTRTTVRAVRDALAKARPRQLDRPAGGVVEVPVSYDGPDLAEVAELTGLEQGGVVAAHTAQTWTVAFAGFAPGFGYLVGQDDRLNVPRRAAPRTRVPAGAVALAGEFSGVYPRESPGGWQLIGRTDLAIWDPRRQPPALLEPGVSVRFVALR